MNARRAGGVRPGVTIRMLVAFVAGLVVLWPAVVSLVANWLAIHDYRHGFLIAAVALLWLVSVARRIPAQDARASLAGAIPLAIALFAWIVAWRANSDIAIEGLLPPVIWVTILAVAGWKVAREAIGPIAYLYFAIPVWEFLLPSLQWLSVTVTEAALAAAGVPAQVTDYLVTLPTGSFEIVEGCSGKRYLVVALAMSVIAGVFQQLRGWRFAALVVAGGLLALVANWFRIFVVIYAGHATEMQHYLVAVEHATFGRVIFIALLVAIYLASRIFARRIAAEVQDSAAHAVSPARAGALLSPALLAPVLLLCVTAAIVHRPVADAGPPSRQLGRLPVAAGRWQGPLPPYVAWSPSFVQPDAERRASYRTAAGERVELYLNLYESQAHGRELVYYGNSLFSPGSWSREWPLQTQVLQSSGAPSLAMIEAQGPLGQRWLLAYVYKVGRWTTVREPLAQASYGLQSFFRPVPGGVVSLTVQCSENCQHAQALVRVFWQEMSGSLLGMIPDEAT